MSHLPAHLHHLLHHAADDPQAWLAREGDLPPPLLDLAMHVALQGTDDEVERLLGLPPLAEQA